VEHQVAVLGAQHGDQRDCFGCRRDPLDHQKKPRAFGL
jgi:hypothetical protein